MAPSLLHSGKRMRPGHSGEEESSKARTTGSGVGACNRGSPHALLENDDVVGEILRRVSQHSRGGYGHALVCRRWRDLSPLAQGTFAAKGRRLMPEGEAVHQLKQFPNVTSVALESMRELSNFTLHRLSAGARFTRGSGDLVCLRHLRLDCKFSTITSDGLSRLFCNHPQLESLGFREARQLRRRGEAVPVALPDALGALKSLRELLLHRVTEIPESIGQLSSLTSLSISRATHLRVLPDSITRLQGLKRFSIFSCFNFESLPDKLGNLTSLQHLKVAACMGLRRMPDSLFDLRSLVSLELMDLLRMQEFPGKGWGRLGKLRVLAVSHVPCLEVVPPSICQLPRLVKCEFRCCCVLSSLPDQLGDLSALRVLNLQCNRMLTSIPGSATRLPRLEVVNIQGSRDLRDIPRQLLPRVVS